MTAQAQHLDRDKELHIATSAIFGAAVVAVKPEWSTTEQVMMAMVPGLAKELYDGTRKGRSGFDAKDLLADLVGAYVGVQGGRWLFAPKPGGGVVVSWSTSF